MGTAVFEATKSIICGAAWAAENVDRAAANTIAAAGRNPEHNLVRISDLPAHETVFALIHPSGPC